MQYQTVGRMKHFFSAKAMFILAIEPRRAQYHDLIQTRDAVNGTYDICFLLHLGS